MAPLGSGQPVAGGIDLDLPGAGVRLRATRWAGDGAPVLLLHGLAAQRRFWNLVVPGLLAGAPSAGRRMPVVALDQRGHGDSARPATGYDAESVAGDAATALDALGISRAVVVGHSWGAAVALAFAAAHPERTLAVVAIDGGFTAAHDRDLSRAETRRRLEPPRIVATPEEIAAMLRAGPLAPWWSDDVEQALLPIFELGNDGLARARLPLDLHMQVVDALLDYDAEAVLAAVRCPAWLVSCEPAGDRAGDGAAAAWGRRKAASLERAGELLVTPRLFRWAGALHDVPLQWPALVSGVVRAAVDEVSRREGEAIMGDAR